MQMTLQRRFRNMRLALGGKTGGCSRKPGKRQSPEDEVAGDRQGSQVDLERRDGDQSPEPRKSEAPGPEGCGQEQSGSSLLVLTSQVPPAGSGSLSSVRACVPRGRRWTRALLSGAVRPGARPVLFSSSAASLGAGTGGAAVSTGRGLGQGPSWLPACAGQRSFIANNVLIASCLWPLLCREQLRQRLRVHRA